MNRWMVTENVLSEVADERVAQFDKWGDQNWPDGTNAIYKGVADTCKAVTDALAASGELTWMHILLEEVYEALAEEDPAKIRAELVQAGAVVAAWIEAIDRRG